MTWTPTQNGHRPGERPAPEPWVGPAGAALVDAVLAERSVSVLLAPVVEIESGAPAGYEALPRGPVEHPLHDPRRLFTAARECGRVAELDLLCRERALQAAVEAGLRSPGVLLVGVELDVLPEALPPASTAFDPFPGMASLRERGVHLVVELTEQTLMTDPARLIAFAGRARAWGCGIALAGLGADPGALALMPLLRPDVVKLDLDVIRRRPGAAVAQTMTAVTAYAEEHDAAVVAEGVDTAEQERAARGLGATHLQGRLYGPPVPSAQAPPFHSVLWRPIVPRPGNVARVVPDSPFALARRRRSPLEGTKALLLEITRLLERQATDLDGLAVVLTGFERDHYLTPATRKRYAEMARGTAFVAAIGRGVPARPAPGVRGADLAPGDPVRDEWDIVVVGPHFAAALLAHDRGDDGPEMQRRFDYVLTYNRATVLDAARSLISRVRP